MRGGDRYDRGDAARLLLRGGRRRLLLRGRGAVTVMPQSAMKVARTEREADRDIQIQ
jgi:hypothetical protein